MALLTILTNHSSNQCVHKKQDFDELAITSKNRHYIAYFSHK